MKCPYCYDLGTLMCEQGRIMMRAKWVTAWGKSLGRPMKAIPHFNFPLQFAQYGSYGIIQDPSGVVRRVSSVCWLGGARQQY